MNDRPARMAIYELETAARLSRLPPARVRRYIRVGLVRPSLVEGRKAFFSEVELARLRTIRRLGRGPRAQYRRGGSRASPRG